MNEVFRYDVFISYTRRDGLEGYALEVARKLRERGLVAFVDTHEFESGHSWRTNGRSALQRSSKILLLLSPSVRESAGIRDELSFNQSLGPVARQISVVVFGVKPAWTESEEGRRFLSEYGIDLSEQLWIPERPWGDVPLLPSDAALDRINIDFKLRRQQNRRLRQIAVALVAMAILAIAAMIGAFVSYGFYRGEHAARRDAEFRLADALVFQSLGESNAQRWSEAAKLLRDAADRYVSLGEGTQLADFGAWMLARQAAPPNTQIKLSGRGFRPVMFLNDETIVAGDGEGRLHLWSAGQSTGEVYPLHSAGVRALALGPASGDLISVGLDLKLRHWNVTQKAEVGTPIDIAGVASVLEVSGDAYAVGLTDGRVVVGVLGTGNVDVFQAHGSDVTGLVIIEPAKKLVSAGRDNELKFWRHEGGKWKAGASVRESGPIVDIASVAGTERVMVATASGNIADYNVVTERMVRPATRPHELAFRLAVAGEVGVSCFEKEVVVWDSAMGAPIRHLVGMRANIRDLAITRDGTRIAAIGGDGLLCQWSTNSPGFLRVDRVPRDAVVQLAPLGDALAFTNREGTLEIRRLTLPQSTRTLPGAGAMITALGFSPSGDWIAAGGADGEFRVQARDGSRPTWQARCSEKLIQVGLSDVGDRALVISHGGSASLLSASGARWTSSSGLRITAGALAQNGAEWVIGTAAGEILLFHGAGAEATRLRVGDGAAITVLQIDTDAGEIVLGDAQGRIEIWHHRTRNWSRSYDFGKQGSAAKAVRSFAGAHLQAIFADCETRVWELATGRQLFRARDTFYPGFNTRLRAASIARTGGVSVVISDDGQVALLAMRACGILVGEKSYE